MVDISQFVTSLTEPVYGLKNLPEQVKGAIIVRMSRAKGTARDLLSKEFAKDLPTHVIEPDLKKSSALFERVFVQYGDASGAETVLGHIIVEGASILAVKDLEQRRIGASFIEQSTRYVQLGRVNGAFPYVTPIELSSNQAMIYQRAMDTLFEAYETVRQNVLNYLLAYTEKPADVDTDVWNDANALKALDVARGLLPLATKTNVGFASNMLTIERMVNHCYSGNLKETVALGDGIFAAAKALAPALLRRVNHPYGEAARWAIYKRNGRYTTMVEHFNAIQEQYADEDVGAIYTKMIDMSCGGNLFYPYIERFTGHDLDVNRVNRHDPLPRMTEWADVAYEFQTTIACWRDLQRHRLVSRHEHPYTNRLGFSLPSLVVAAHTVDQTSVDVWNNAVEQAFALFDLIKDERQNAEVAAYALPLCTIMRWASKVNLRELCHLVELRSTPAAHDEYKKIAIDMYNKAYAIAQDTNDGYALAILNEIKYVGAFDEHHLPRLQEEARQKRRGFKKE